MLAVAGVAGLLLYAWALWKIPDRMHLHAAQDRYNARILVISVGGGFVVVMGLLYTARTYRLSQRGQITDRFTNALEQLNADQLYVRVGAIQALGRLVHDSSIHHDDVIEVLTSFVHGRAAAVTATGPGTPTLPAAATAGGAPADVQAALTVLAHRPPRPERRPVALAGTCLTGADLTGAKFAGCDLTAADLRNANLRGADLSGAKLKNASLHQACLAGADLTGADLSVAELPDADLSRANLRLVFARGADFTRANLAGADLTGANLAVTRMSHAFLHGASLVRTYLSLSDLAEADLTKADLRDVRGLTGEQLQQSVNDSFATLQGRFDQPRWERTPGPRDTPVVS
jgi:uncharacterized protein YjbI with pentapeptide repeats